MIRLCNTLAILSAAGLLSACGGHTSPTSAPPATSVPPAPITGAESPAPAHGTTRAPGNAVAPAASTTAAVTSTGEPVPPVEFSGEVGAPFAERVLAQAGSVLKDPRTERDLSEVLTGTAREDMDNQRRELATQGLHSEGSPRVLWAKDAAPQGAAQGQRVLEVCVDNSGVITRDEAGNEVSAGAGRSRMIIAFDEVDGRWLMTGTSFPDDPNC